MNAPMTILVRPYRPADAGAFRDLNLAWIEAYFSVEPEDRAQLENPEGSILAKGGRIFIAESEGAAVGAVALVPGHGENIVELIKMSAREDLRGKGIGRALMDAALEAARDMGAARVWLETNTVLDAALALYRKAGFKQLPATECAATPYARCNCQMVLEL